MDTPLYETQIIIGGPSQQTEISALPAQIITRQSGQLNIEAVGPEPNFLPFDLTSLINTDAKVVPYRTSVSPVTLGTGVISYTGERFTLQAAESPSDAGTFTLTIDGETTAGIAFNADGPTILAALEALPSRSPGDFEVSVVAGINIGDAGALVNVELSGGFALTDRSSADFSGLSGGTAPTFSTTLDQSTVQNFYSVTWVKDTIPAAWSTFDTQDRDGSIALFVELEDADDFYQFVNRFNVNDGNLGADQQTLPLVTFINYYNQIYEYSSTTTDTNPGAGKFQLDSTTLASVTEMYVADDNKSGVDTSTMFQALQLGSYIYLGNPNVEAEAALYRVSGAITDNSGWTTIPLTYIDSGSPSFVNGSVFSVSFQSVAIISSVGIAYDFNSSTVDADPGAGNFRLNNASPGSATFIYIADDDSGGLNQATYLQSLFTGDYIRISEFSSSGSSVRYTVNGTPTSATGYTKVPVTAVDVGPSSFTSGNACGFTIDSIGISNVVEDTTPQLGGVLDSNSNQIRESKGADVASAATLTLGSDGNFFDVTGTTTITSIATLAVGTKVTLQFDAALVLTHNATDLVLPTGANITTSAGDTATFIEYAAGDWICVNYQRADGSPLVDATNFAIDGKFYHWRKATSQTTSGYGSADMWIHAYSGANGSPSFSRVAHTLGETDHPYYAQGVNTGLSDAVNGFILTGQRLRILEETAGKKVTFTVRLKGSVAGTVGLRLEQYFGTGGSPSPTVSKAQEIAITTSWAEYSFTTTLDSLSSKQLGTNNDYYLAFYIDEQIGSVLSLGYTTNPTFTGTLDIDNARLGYAKEVSDYTPSEELIRMMPYYIWSTASCRGYAAVANAFFNSFMSFPAMVALPAATAQNGGATAEANLAGGVPTVAVDHVAGNYTGFRFEVQAAAIGDVFSINKQVILDARL